MALAERNPVIVKFIETLTHNENERQNEGEKLFKCAVAVDAIYGSRHLKYVSAISLAASAIKYSLARSRMVIDIAACNCTKFEKLRTNFFNVIGCSESEIHRPRTRPSFIAESNRFRVQIRKTQFVNPNVSNRVFHDISGEWILSEEMKSFSEIARMKRIEFIKGKLRKHR